MQGRGSIIFSVDPDPAQLRKKNPDPTLIRNEEKNIFIFKVGRHKKIDLINHNFKLEFVYSGLYFVQDENNL